MTQQIIKFGDRPKTACDCQIERGPLRRGIRESLLAKQRYPLAGNLLRSGVEAADMANAQGLVRIRRPWSARYFAKLHDAENTASLQGPRCSCGRQQFPAANNPEPGWIPTCVSGAGSAPRGPGRRPKSLAISSFPRSPVSSGCGRHPNFLLGRPAKAGARRLRPPRASARG